MKKEKTFNHLEGKEVKNKRPLKINQIEVMENTREI